MERSKITDQLKIGASEILRPRRTSKPSKNVNNPSRRRVTAKTLRQVAASPPAFETNIDGPSTINPRDVQTKNCHVIGQAATTRPHVDFTDFLECQQLTSTSLLPELSNFWCYFVLAPVLCKYDLLVVQWTEQSFHGAMQSLDC